MIRRAFVRALSGAILTTLLGVKAWRLEVSEDWDLGDSTIGTIYVRVPDTPPTAARLGDRWFRTDTATLYSFDGAEWVAEP